jgi:hypothetical protein
MSVFSTGAATTSSKLLLTYPQEAVWNPFQTHYFSEIVVVLRIEPRTSGFVVRNFDH